MIALPETIQRTTRQQGTLRTCRSIIRLPRRRSAQLSDDDHAGTEHVALYGNPDLARAELERVAAPDVLLTSYR